MLENLAYRNYISKKTLLTPSGVEYIDTTRASDPARPVGVNSRTSIVFADVSTKMGVTIATESHAERSVAIQLNYDSQVFEFWDQPVTIEIRKINKRGARRRTRYTPDFLVLKDDGPVVLEVKTLDEVEKLVESEPNSWVKTADGYDYLPAKEVFESEYGLKFRVVVSTRQDQQIAENIRILLASRDSEFYNPLLGLRVEKLLLEQPVWRLDELNTELGEESFNAVIQMIDTGYLAFNHASASLSAPDRCFVARNNALLMTSSFIKDDALSKVIETDGFESIALERAPQGKIAERVLKRLKRVQSDEKSSSVRRWKKQIREGADKNLTPFQSLIDADRNISGRNSKLVPEVKAFLEHFASDVRLSMPNESMHQVYCEYCAQVKTAHPVHPPVSKQTFYDRMAKIAPELVGEVKGGKRMSIAMSPPTDPKHRHIVSSLPWMKASVDHCCVNIFLVVYEDGDNIYVARPWLSLMIDVATSEVLAFSISFQPPSRRSCAKLIRECVRRHGKLPREIIVDHGSDFTSVYFRSLLAHYRVTHSLRPSGNPRAGSEVEGFFGEYMKQWLSQRPGFVAGLKTLRAIDGRKSPDKSAVLTIDDLYQELARFLDWRSSKPRGASSKSTSVIYSERIAKFPFIPISVDYNDEFVLATCVEAGKYKIDYQRGIHIKNLHYYCPELRELQGVKSRTEVRIDPENPYVVYVLINDKWHRAINTEYNAYVEKSLNFRISEGVRVYECSSMRRNLSLSKGVENAETRHRFDQKIEERLADGTRSNNDSASKEIKIEADSVKQKVKASPMVFTTRKIPTEEW